jgi:hypothetical protein
VVPGPDVDVDEPALVDSPAVSEAPCVAVATVVPEIVALVEADEAGEEDPRDVAPSAPPLDVDIIPLDPPLLPSDSQPVSGADTTKRRTGSEDVLVTIKANVTRCILKSSAC